MSNMSMAQSNNSPSAVIDFKQVQELDNWVIINDTVMGGRSRTQLDIEGEYLSFSGMLSLENNGGFASIRRVYDNKSWLPDAPLQIKVKGDGREYQFRLRTNRQSDGVAYVANFTTQAEQESVFEFIQSDFVPQFRGRIVSGAPALNFADIEQVGLMLADKNPGQFTLLVEHLSQVSK